MKYIHSGGWFLMMSAKKNEVAKTAVQLEAFSRLPVKLCSIKNNIYSLKKTLKKISLGLYGYFLLYTNSEWGHFLKTHPPG